MPIKRWCPMCVFIFVLWTAGLQAQTSLNQIITDESGATEQYYTLNEEALLADDFKPGTLFSFEMSPGELTDFVLTKKRSYVPGTISFTARKASGSERVLIFTYSNGSINGLYHESHQKAISLKYQPENGQNYLISEVAAEADKIACGLHENPASFIPPIKPSGENDTKRAKGTSEYVYSPAPLYASEDDSVTIDVMIVYTDAAETYANASSGGIGPLIAQAFSLSQTALDNSLLGIELRLVHLHKTTYNELNDGVASGDRLRRLTQNPNNPVFDPSEGYDGYMEEVHGLREQYGADVVSMVARIEDTGGVGWRLSSTGGDPTFAFNVNRAQQVASSYTLIHEVGHNMGNEHSRTQKGAAADDSGGLFHYSTGYQDEAKGFHTVMAYDTTKNNVILSEAPLFSSPDLQWQGVPAGSNNRQRPVNNAKSMKIIKRSIASYFPTVVDPPSAALSTNSITVEMNREDAVSVPLNITNSGLSALIWSADFDFTSQTVAKGKHSSGTQTLQPLLTETQKRLPANYGGSLYAAKAKAAESILYTTSFESIEGFIPGTYKGRAEWRSLNEASFDISEANPQSGSQHLRLTYDGGNTQFIASPFLGYQLFGSYEVSLSLSVTDIQERYDIYIMDGKTGEFSAGVIIAQQTLYAADLDETNSLTFVSTSAQVSADIYRTLRIVYNASNETIDYYFAGNLIAQNSYINGFTPGVIQVLHQNQRSGASFDIDNLEIKRTSAPYPWLEVPQMTGVALEQETKPITLEFNTNEISAGTYETLLKVQTNDPTNSSFEVPITLNVNDVVPLEGEDIPGQISLDQNYPNPFNPTTTISYTLNEPQEVKLEVFNIQGKKVTTLQKGRMGAGNHQIDYDASSLSSGVYIYRLQTANRTLTRQMVLIK